MLTWKEILSLLYERHNRSWSKTARTLGLSDPAVMQWRDGHTIPSYRHADVIAKAIDRPRQEVVDALTQARIERDEKGVTMTLSVPVKPPMAARLPRTTRPARHAVPA